MADNTSTFNPSDANSWLNVLTSQNAANPNAQQSLSQLSNTSGLDLSGRYPGYEASRYLTGPEYYNLASQYGFYNSLQPQEHQALFTMINQMMNPQTMADQYRQQAQGAAMQNTPQLLNQLKAAGAGQGYQEGAVLNQQNEANRQANSYSANLFSPAGEAQRGQAIQSLYQSQAPNLNNLGQLQGIAVGTPRNETGLQAVGQIAGDISGMAGGGNIFGGSSGGGSGFGAGSGYGGAVNQNDAQYGNAFGGNYGGLGSVGTFF